MVTPLEVLAHKRDEAFGRALRGGSMEEYSRAFRAWSSRETLQRRRPCDPIGLGDDPHVLASDYRVASPSSLDAVAV